MILNQARAVLVHMLAGSAVGSVFMPTYFMIGSGNASVSSTDTTLDHPRDRQLMTSRTEAIGSTWKVTYIADWTNTEISGTRLTEFGVIPSGATLTGSMWSRSVLTPITFNGTNELRIEENWEFY